MRFLLNFFLRERVGTNARPILGSEEQAVNGNRVRKELEAGRQRSFSVF